MVRFLISILFLFSLSIPVNAQDTPDCVILVHGLMRSSTSMRSIERDLKANKFEVVNFNYPSTAQTIESLALEQLPMAIAKCAEKARISFVTHSMGGILVRAYYKANKDKKPYRVVMIAPPNQGSEIIDDQAFAWLGGIAGKAGAELGTGEDSLPNQLGAVDYPVGVIAGNGTINPIFSDLIPGEDDGAVAVSRTHVVGETDWVLIKATHSFMTYNITARRQALLFLLNGKFEQ